MRRILFAWLFFLVFSVANNFLFADDFRLPRVVDEVNLLTTGEKTELENRIAAIRGQYDFDLVIVKVFNTGGKSTEAFAEDFFDASNYGVGPDADGALFLNVVDDHSIWICGTGKGEVIFNNRRIENTLNNVLPFFAEDNYFQACRAFLTQAENYLSGAGGSTARGNAGEKAVMYLCAAGLALILSLISFFYYRTRHKTAGIQQLGQFSKDYIKEGSVNFIMRDDIFISTHTSVSRNAASGQAISSTRSRGMYGGSSGRSHSGGGRRY